MASNALIAFIVQCFLEADIKSVALFHCWDVDTQFSFLNHSSSAYLFTQLIAIDRFTALDNFELRYFANEKPRMGVFLDLNCENSTIFTNMSSAARLYNAHKHWLIYDERANLTHFRELFINANMTVDADVTYVMPVTATNRSICTSSALTLSSASSLTALSSSSSTSSSLLSSPLLLSSTSTSTTSAVSFIMYDVYNNGRHLGGKLNMTIDRLVSCTDTDCKLQCFLSDLHLYSKYQNRCNLTDITLRIATVITEIPITGPTEHLQEYLRSINNTHIDGIARYGFKLLIIMQEMLNCNLSYSYTNIWSSSEVFGGAIGALVQEKVDLVSTPFLFTASRLKYLSGILETSGLRSICLFRTPRNSGIQAGVFLEPFSSTVWFIFGILLALASFMIWGTFQIEYRRLKMYFKYLPSLLTIGLLAWGHACAQGTHIIPQTSGGRMAFFFLSLITFLIYNYYTSVVVSSLLGSPVKSRIKTLGQLADSSLEVALEPLPFTWVYLNASTRTDVRRFVQRKIESKRNPASVWIPPEEGIKRVRDQPGFVFVFEATSGYSTVEKLYKPHEICDLNEIMLRPGKSLHSQVHKNSTYREIFRQKQVRMQETGIIQKHRRYWVRTKLNCFANNFIINVGLEFTAPLFIMLLCSYVLVFFLLAIELTYKRYTDQRAEESHAKLALLLDQPNP